MRLPPILPLVTLLALLGPVAAGLFGTGLAALGHLPAAGMTGFSVAPFAALWAWPGLGAAIRLSVQTGGLATVISLALTLLLLAGWAGTRPFRALMRLLAPLLSVPHAAAAFGLMFLIQPSGWIVRAISPWATGWSRPPDLLLVQDPMGLALIAGLVVKEVPFLLLVALAALSQIDAAARMRVATALGYGRMAGWFLTVFPALYRRIRLPVYVVLTYSMSVVDVAAILGPTTPAPLSVQIVDWMSAPDLSLRSLASAAALLQLGLVLAALLAWRSAEHLIGHIGARAAYRGRRRTQDYFLRGLGLGLGVAATSAVLLGLLGLATWSFAERWSFPAMLPDAFTLRSWQRHGSAALATLATTLTIAAAATLIGLVLTLGCLETEDRRQLRLTENGQWLLYLPLLVPQTVFLPGMQIGLLTLGIDRSLWAVVLAHLVFVLPYLRLSLEGPYKSWDVRQATVAAAMGASDNRIFFGLRLPMLLAPILTAAAIGMAVSVGQYLPTLLVGGGGMQTLTTESLALAAGGDRRAIGVYALVQTATALLPFALALAVPALAWRNRRGMWHD
ncbi:ABC transporter permease [Tritonibacter horizontis]|uniref:Inner membrane ABC transporter permease protein YnjC n=1 Tax=Tritonibacter horizontis TaxID=1768241 RepID=A0A132C076_9RHOB|nr:ABC transporter permease subunit [Tritonibacter horizontis]KUP93985.1 inner membrane ABC transporter permease protein YnjC [Tritonibacter horizontis]